MINRLFNNTILIDNYINFQIKIVYSFLLKIKMDNYIKTECLHNSTCLIDNFNIFGNNLNLHTYEQDVGNGNQ